MIKKEMFLNVTFFTSM